MKLLAQKTRTLRHDYERLARMPIGGRSLARDLLSGAGERLLACWPPLRARGQVRAGRCTAAVCMRAFEKRDPLLGFVDSVLRVLRRIPATPMDDKVLRPRCLLR